jgi:hypothetical protein
MDNPRHRISAEQSPIGLAVASEDCVDAVDRRCRPPMGLLISSLVGDQAGCVRPGKTPTPL